MQSCSLSNVDMKHLCSRVTLHYNVCICCNFRSVDYFIFTGRRRCRWVNEGFVSLSILGYIKNNGLTFGKPSKSKPGAKVDFNITEWQNPNHHLILKASHFYIISQTELFTLKLQVYLWFWDFLKVERKAELLVEPGPGLGLGSWNAASLGLK